MQVVLYRIGDHHSKQSFNGLLQYWNDILVSEGSGVYKHWINIR